jgi:hypothetical protein
MADDLLSYTPLSVLDGPMTGTPLITSRTIHRVRARAHTHARRGANLANFGHLSTAR